MKWSKSKEGKFWRVEFCLGGVLIDTVYRRHSTISITIGVRRRRFVSIFFGDWFPGIFVLFFHSLRCVVSTGSVRSSSLETRLSVFCISNSYGIISRSQRLHVRSISCRGPRLSCFDTGYRWIDEYYSTVKTWLLDYSESSSSNNAFNIGFKHMKSRRILFDYNADVHITGDRCQRRLD